MQIMDKKIVGIDPGVSGSIVILEKDFTYVDHLLMPIIKTGKSSRVNGAAIVAFLKPYAIEHAYIEQVHSMPKQGVSSSFNFGHSAGVAEGVIQGMFIPYNLVTPQSWKKKAKLIGTDKDAARSMAIRLYPDLRVLDLKGKGQAVADALLIARYGQ